MNCDELRGSYELYALGLLDEPERSEAAEHLSRQCPVCTPEYQGARSLNALMSTLVSDAAPSKGLKRRILASVGVEERRGWLTWLPGIAAVAATVAAVVIGLQLREQSRERELVSAELRQMRAAVALMREPETTQVTFGKGPQGRVLVNSKRGVLLLASNLPPVGPGKTYEFWIIPKGGSPLPSGLFQSDVNGNAMHLVPGPLDVGATGAVAVSVEPDGGSPAPTTTPIIVAPLTE